MWQRGNSAVYGEGNWRLEDESVFGKCEKMFGSMMFDRCLFANVARVCAR